MIKTWLIPKRAHNGGRKNTFKQINHNMIGKCIYKEYSCLLVFLTVSFAVQKLLILMKSLAFGDVSRKNLMQLRSKRLLPGCLGVSVG